MIAMPITHVELVEVPWINPIITTINPIIINGIPIQRSLLAFFGVFFTNFSHISF